MDTAFFLDLEETVIDSWGSARLVNTDSVRKFLRLQGAQKVGVFSFAIQTDSDRQEFFDKIAPNLAKALDIEFRRDCPTVAELRALDQHVTSTWFDSVFDFIQLRGKQQAFTLWANTNFQGTNCVLVDDTVDDITVHNRLTGRNIHFVNVVNVSKFNV
jgi:hypothetical protein